MIDNLNKEIKIIDITMYSIIDKISKYKDIPKVYLDRLYKLYEKLQKIYSMDTTKYELDDLTYTDINLVVSLLIEYNYIIRTTEDINDKEDYDEQVVKPLPDNDTVQEIFVEQKNPFNANGPVYAFTNEALNQYMPKYDLQGKSVLASLGSGDFALNAYLLGASSVDTFDINLYTYYFYQLKKALILKYDYDNFCKLVKNPIEIFHNFDEYKSYLDKDCINFFNNLLNIYKDDIPALLRKVYIDKVGEEKNQWNESNTFDTFEELFLVAQYKNLYFKSEENYNKAKEELLKDKDSKFYFDNIFNMELTSKYDVIYLSNIGDYCDDREEFERFIEQIKEKYLNPSGIIIIVSITNHIILDDEVASNIRMDWDEMEEFNKNNTGVARLPITNLGIQNVYTTYPYNVKKY